MFEEIRDIIAEQLSIDDLDELTLDTSLKDDLNACLLYTSDAADE